MGYRNSQGLTLVELVVIFAVLSISLTIVWPVFKDLSSRHQVSTATNLFIASLHLARSEAARSGVYVSLCPGDAGGCTGQDYDDGWIVFIDLDHDGKHQPPEPLVRVFELAVPDLSMSGNSTVDDHISYTPTGYTESPNGAFQAGTVTICRPPHARRVVISRTGRPRVEVSRC